MGIRDIEGMVRRLEAAQEAFEESCDPDDHVDPILEAVEALAATRDARVIEPLVRALERNAFCPEVDDAIEAALVEHGRAAVETLLRVFEELADEDDMAQRRAAFVQAMVATGVKDDRVFDCVLDLVEVDPSMGALMLGAFGDPRGSELLLAMLDEAPVGGNAELLMNVGEGLALLGAALTVDQQKKLERARRELGYLGLRN